MSSRFDVEPFITAIELINEGAIVPVHAAGMSAFSLNVGAAEKVLISKPVSEPRVFKSKKSTLPQKERNLFTTEGRYALDGVLRKVSGSGLLSEGLTTQVKTLLGPKGVIWDRLTYKVGDAFQFVFPYPEESDITPRSKGKILFGNLVPAQENIRDLAQRANIPLSAQQAMKVAIIYGTAHELGHAVSTATSIIDGQYRFRLPPDTFDQIAPHAIIRHKRNLAYYETIAEERLAEGFAQIGLAQALAEAGVSEPLADRLLQARAERDNHYLAFYTKFLDTLASPYSPTLNFRDALDRLYEKLSDASKVRLPNFDPMNVGYLLPLDPAQIREFLVTYQ